MKLIDMMKVIMKGVPYVLILLLVIVVPRMVYYAIIEEEDIIKNKVIGKMSKTGKSVDEDIRKSIGNLFTEQPTQPTQLTLEDRFECSKKCDWGMADTCLTRDKAGNVTGYDERCRDMNNEGYYCQYSGKEFDKCNSRKCGISSEFGKCTEDNLLKKLKSNK